MTLPASGQISMSQVNVELSYSATAMISLNDAAVRSLFQVPSGQISMSDGWGKSASNPGIVWSSYFSRESLFGIAANTTGPVYIAVGTNGAALRSTDTSTWTAQTTGVGANTLNGVVYGGSQFVAVGALGIIVTSPDGITWTARTSGVSTTLSAITYSASAALYVVTGSSNVILTSPDGITWTARTSTFPAGTAINCCTYSPTLNRFVCSGALSTTTYIQYSNNGTTWTSAFTVTTANYPTDLIWTGVCFYGIQGSAGYNYTSADGITWTATQVVPVPLVYAIATDGGSFLMGVGTYTGTATMTLYQGANSTSPSWNSAVSITLNVLRDVMYDSNNSNYLAVGASGFIVAINPSNYLFNQKVPGTNQSVNGAVYFGSSYCLVTNMGTTLVTATGQTYSSAYITTSILYSVAYGAGLLVAVGSSGILFSSPDGLTWTARTSGTVTTLRGVCWTGAQFIAVAASTIVTSPDGITWTLRSSGGTTILNAVTAASTTSMVTVGNSGNIRTSSDGITWTLRTSGTTSALYGVAWTGAVFIAVGAAGGIRTSPTGVTWTARTSGTSNILRSVFWTGALAVAVGDIGTILTSPDGITWTTRTSGTTSNLLTVAGASNKLLAAGAAATVIVST